MSSDETDLTVQAFYSQVVHRRPVALLALVCALIAGVARPAAASSDTYSSRQWNMRAVGAETAWKTGTGDGVTIAIIDSGVDLKHDDLAGAFVPGHDFVDNDSVAQDGYGHGTHVAGIAAARADNGIGVAGVAPNAKIMPVRVLDSTGRETGTAIHEGVHWAVDHGADVINLSLGADVITEDVFGGTLTDDVNYAWSKGVVPVISAGNDAFFRTDWRQANTIIVTATNRANTRASYANAMGPFVKWGMAAPGGDSDQGNDGQVFSTLWTKDGKAHYGYATGTSMAAPHVAGAAAVLRGLGLTPQQTVDRLLSTAKDIGPSGTYGSGLLDVDAAVAGLRPVFTPSAPTSGPTTPPSTVRPVSDFAGPGPHRRSSIGNSPSPTSTGSDIGSLPSPGTVVAAAKPPSSKSGGGSSHTGLWASIGVAAAVVAGSGGYFMFRRRRRAA